MSEILNAPIRNGGFALSVDFILPYICVAAAAFITTYACVPLARRLAISLDAVDYPSKRRINKTPIPRMGGVAVLAGLIAALIVQLAGTWYLGWPPVLIPHPSMTINYPLLGISFLLIFLTGAVDDVVSLRPRAKLAGQAVAAPATGAEETVYLLRFECQLTRSQAAELSAWLKDRNISYRRI